MELQLIQKLNQLNSDFYTCVAPSFSQTRQLAWEGWSCVIEEIESLLKRRSDDGCGGEERLIRFADVACGNLRFEALCAQQLNTSCEIHGFDNCLSLMKDFGASCDGQSAIEVVLHEIDLIEALISRKTNENSDNSSEDRNVLIAALSANHKLRGLSGRSFDGVVSFGFMHHIPSYELRRDFLRELSAATQKGGSIIVSLWRFLDDERFQNKARKTREWACEKGFVTEDELSQFEEGDALLSWQSRRDCVRYCHSISEKEIFSLEQDLSDCARLKGRFEADGKTGRLNTYLVWERI